MDEKHGWRVSLSLTAVGIAGTLAGAVVPQLLTSRRESTAAFQNQQREAYVAYLSALDKDRLARQRRQAAAERKSEASRLKLKAREQAEKRATEDEALANQLELQFELDGGAALRRIAIYGDKKVVEAMAMFSRQTTSLAPCGPHWKEDLAIWQAMREAALGRGQEVSVRDLGELALFCKPVAEK